MKKMFLCSSFIPVADFLKEFLGPNLVGKKVSYLSTASVVKKSKFYVKWAKEKLTSWGLIVEDIDVSTMSYESVKHALQTNNYIFVCGGNPIYLLDQLQRTKTDQLIIDQINAGKVYIGESSGAIVLANDINYILPIVGPEIVEPPKTYHGLNMLDVSVVPHYQTYPFVDRAQKIVDDNFNKLKLVTLTNNQALLINNQHQEIKTAFSNEGK